jgi:hypothetical protein
MTKKIVTVVLIWAVAATAISLSGILANTPGPTLQIIIFALLALFILVSAVSQDLRSWTLSLRLRRLTLFHAWRIIPGTEFLILHSQGRLPWAFAVPGGYGDIAIGVTAPLAALLVPPTSRARAISLALWNLLGLLDLANVVATAARLTIQQPGSMDLLRQFPMSLLPLFLVPVTLIAHLIALAQLWEKHRTPKTAI